MVNTQAASNPGKSELGKVITFYSYKGGVGRSLAMANVAALVAKWGKKVLVIDWDLEAPGLENFYKTFLSGKDVSQKEGIIDLLMLADGQASQPVSSIDWSRFITQLSGELACLWIMTSGKKGEDYAGKVRSFNISKFFGEKDGGKFLEDIRNYWIREFDFVFIDSRTGLTDSSGVCSIHMPDVLALLFTPNEQSFKGSLDVANKAAAAHGKLIYDRLKLKLFPIPTRIENNESGRRKEWLERFAVDLAPLFNWLPRKESDPAQFNLTPKEIIDHIKVPYLPEYAYGEQLPAIAKGTADPQDIGWVYETIAAIIANNFDNLDYLKSSRDQFVKKAKGEDFVDHSDYERKIAQEKDEKKKLEESILRSSVRRRNRNIIISVAVVLLGLGIYFLSKRGPADPSPDVKQEAAYQLFVSSFSDSAKGKKGGSTLDLLTQYNNYFALAPSFREKATAYKKILDSSISKVLTPRIETLYTSLSDSSYALSLFADTLVQFDSLKNISARRIFSNGTYLTYLYAQRKSLRPSLYNHIISINSLKSDSSSFEVEYSENAFSIFSSKNKLPGSLAQLIFNYDLKVISAAPVSEPVRLITPPLVDSARVFILSGAKDSTYFGTLRDDLQSAGFTVMGAKYLLDLGRPDRAEIRYFNVADMAQAEKLAAYMQAKIPGTTYTAVKYTDLKARPGYLEIWTGR